MMQLRTYLIERTNESEHLIAPCGALGVFGFVAFYFFNSNFISPEVYENILLRIVAGTLSLLLMAKNYWPQQFKKTMPIIWHLTLFFNLPFFFTFMILKNSTNPVWPLYGVHALTVLILLTDWLTFVLLALIGTFIGTISYVLTTPDPRLPENFSSILVVYISIIGYCAYFSQKNSKAYQERLSSMKMLAGAIAHELRTPLASISMMSTNLKKSLTSLFKDKENQPSTANDKFLMSVPEKLNDTAKSAFNIIDMVLMNLKDVSSQKTDRVISAEYYVQEALSDYPLTDFEKSLIHTDCKEDFEFKGDETLFKHVLFNLLKNALHYVKAAGKGEITITLKKDRNENYLIFKDTGKGMPESMVPHIFDRFYSRTQHGTGIGLAFCKSVMSKFHGSIRCESRENVHTTFILAFPAVGEFEKAIAA